MLLSVLCFSYHLECARKTILRNTAVSLIILTKNETQHLDKNARDFFYTERYSMCDLCPYALIPLLAQQLTNTNSILACLVCFV